MKLRKALACILSAAILSAAAACGQETAASSSAAASTAASNSASAVTLQYYTIGPAGKDLTAVNNALNELLMKKIGVRVKINYIDWDDYTTKLSAIIDSGTSFDIAFTSSQQGDFVGNARKGAWLDLTSYLKTTGKKMYDAIDPLFWTGIKIDGKTYGIPTNKEIATPDLWIYSKALAEKYGIDVKQYKTLESLEPILKKVKQAEPQCIPMALDRNSENFFSIDGYEYIVNHNIPLMVKSSDTSLKIVNIYETDCAKQVLHTLRRYYKLGYINADAAFKTNSDDLKNYTVLWHNGSGGPYSDSTWANNLGYPVVCQQVSPSVITSESTRGGIMSVSAHTQHPKECVRFLNCLNTDAEVRNMLNYGIEGTHYRLSEKHQVIGLDSGYRGIQYTQGNWFILYTTVNDPVNKWDAYRKFNKEAVRSQALGFTPDISDSSSAAQAAAVVRVTEKYYPSLMTGTVDPNKILPLFLQELREAGIDKLQSTLQQQITAWKAKGF